jgi:hypothetical protein
MGKLKPLGSEKLTGQEKLDRIMEIARYNEVPKSETNTLSTTEYSINVSDGSEYQIVKEKMGYVIKKNISESEVDYIEPMRNRKYYNSYSQALKRLNLVIKESNRLNGQDEEISLFGEQKKFVLKTPKPAMDEPMMDTPVAAPAEPPAVPEPQLPDSPEALPPSDDAEMPSEEMPMDDMGAEEMPMDDMGQGGQGVDLVTFKSIQKLTGKLTQKIREYEQEKGLTSENIKYVLNMVISAVDLNQLSGEDKEDVLSKFESDEESDEMDMDMDMEDMDSEDITGDSEVEDIQANMDVAVDQEMGESSIHDTIMDSIFSESKIDKVISKYFEMSDSEKKDKKEKMVNEEIKRKSEFAKKVKSIENLSETIEQELSSKKFLQENKNYIFLGKTNKKNLVFENKSGQVKISPEGFVI